MAARQPRILGRQDLWPSVAPTKGQRNHDPDAGGGFTHATFGLLRNFDAVMEALGSLYSEAHEFQTLVIDSLDWLEPLIWQHTAQQHNQRDIEAFGYGKGYQAALDTWRTFLDAVNTLRDECGMGVLLIAHAEIRRFDSPETEPYDRYQPKLHRSASALVQEHGGLGSRRRTMAAKRKQKRTKTPDTMGPSQWRLQHGDFTPPIREADPETGRPVQHRRVVDTLGMMLANGTITHRRRAALRHQRDERSDRRAVPLLAPLHGRLAHRPDGGAACQPSARGRRLVRLPARALAADHPARPLADGGL
jgi:hypothetical protein